MKNKKANLPVISIVGIILLVLALFYVAASNLSSTVKTEKSKIICDVSIKNRVFGDASIDSVSCHNEGTCFFNSLPLGLIKDKGTVKLLAGSDLLDSATYSTAILFDSTDTKTLKGCTDLSQVTIRLENADGQFIMQKEVNLQ